LGRPLNVNLGEGVAEAYVTSAILLGDDSFISVNFEFLIF